MLLGDEDESGQVLAEPPASATAENSETTRPRPVESSSPPPVFHPLAYRGVVAQWPIVWREQWGRRANELEESGLTWRDAETQAFVEVWNLRRQSQPDNSPTVLVGSTSPERN
jgi:hypothetical protein